MSFPQKEDLSGYNFVNQADICLKFLQNFEDKLGEKKYQKILLQIAKGEANVLPIYLDDIDEFENLSGGDEKDRLADRIEQNINRYISIFQEIADRILPAQELEHFQPTEGDKRETYRRHNLLELAQADNRAQQGEGDEVQPGPIRKSLIPPALMRRYELRFIPRQTMKPLLMRKVMANQIGHFVKVRGVVLRSTPVHPLIRVATYHCSACGCNVYQEINARQYTPLSNCPTEMCRTNRTVGTLTFEPRESKFVKFQEVRLQELTSEVPVGHIPRHLTVFLEGDLTQSCLPGDVIAISGAFLPLPATGFRKLRMGLLVDTYLQGQHIEKIKKTGELNDEENLKLAEEEEERDKEQEGLELGLRLLRSEESGSSSAIVPASGAPQRSLMSLEDRQQLLLQRRIEYLRNHSENIYEQLAASIAPQLFGLVDEKKAILLQMMGSPTVIAEDGMLIRGDIHICFMGDPGVAKSQLLKAVCDLVPRSVYTTGKGSTGVGLTAAVLKDPMTGQTILEGGSLVMADRGVCCIDEFDKMDDADKTAIHEVMEQQTVSIAKGGITTTLNARTAILAAANPAFGRYNRRRSPWENINLPPALLSRFDLLFLIIDKPDFERDLELGRYIGTVHRTKRSPLMQKDALISMLPDIDDVLGTEEDSAKGDEQLPEEEEEEKGKKGKGKGKGKDKSKRKNVQSTTSARIIPSNTLIPHSLLSAYIERARRLQPVIPAALSDSISELFVAMRREEVESDRPQTYTSARSLLAILRLARALARVWLRSEVTPDDLREAKRLVDSSRAQLQTDDERRGRKAKEELSRGSEMYNLLRDMMEQEREKEEMQMGIKEMEMEKRKRKKKKTVIVGAGMGVLQFDEDEDEDEYDEVDVIGDEESASSRKNAVRSGRAKERVSSISRHSAQSMMVQKGYSVEAFNQFLEEYVELGILVVTDDKKTIILAED
ncbi:DNA replication licensing factor MCM7 [Monocercomonoides exilis]|uniref:DNA replication licensing factor MCM7 n=1 Tax=Monocercomonoides exilis TaxID=2049356 RepID=UPI003559DBCC|nr:DNA replication licensing factor MCM7 [Monocercomonoides exilis]|eukprot:MONOS_15521.1-p1 / transcript=MONOS_15521.1 / gene=MONOS_15521 / organism=Monocercomonoides_exilis_PA203 / gene_product=DNA replication licensing factor MCM7 / transcript_product=DNA replication licensing factor MCM7 / location=Mono_scaffold01260:4979-7931(+) / protein_length=947 / sequence_SO=supercontig / SO=protein_coding / is_pseudo=false